MPDFDDPNDETPGSSGDIDTPQRIDVEDDATLVLESQRAQAESALAEQKEKYLRLAAEFDNYRKRAVRERDSAGVSGQAVLIRGLMDVLDDIARFARLDPSTTDAPTVIAGAALIEQKTLKALAAVGLEVVDPVGQPFDPSLHEAISTAPATAPDEDNTVAHVYQVGYVLKGQLLRAARVVVKQWPG
jgi:molecular chaperone GrpE